MTRPVTFITVRAESDLRPAVLCTRARPVCIAQASSTATHVRSNRSAAQRNHHARSRAITMSMLETLPGRWPAPRASSGSGMSGKKIEMRFAHLKRILMLDRLRLGGPRGVQEEFVLAAIAQNLRRLAALVARTPPAHAPVYRVAEEERVRPADQSRLPLEIAGRPPSVAADFATKSAISGLMRDSRILYKTVKAGRCYHPPLINAHFLKLPIVLLSPPEVPGAK